MTTQAPTMLPEVEYPLMTRLVSDRIFPQTKPQQVTVNAECPHCKQRSDMQAALDVPEDRQSPVVWTVSKPHPMMPTVKVVRMFVVPEERLVKIYSVSDDGTAAFRNNIPMSAMRFSEETMGLDLFADELAFEESGGEEDDEPEEPEEESGPQLAAVPNNT